MTVQRKTDANRIYAAIDLKSFYASVECRERGLDPLNTHLVVADESRTEKTICLAVTPSLKKLGIPGRARLFEVNEQVRLMNASRLLKAPEQRFSGTSCFADELERNKSLRLDFLIAPPRMALYINYSHKVVDIYSRFVSPEDIHVYSVDEVFMDITGYPEMYGMTARQLVEKMILCVLNETGITATAGIGTNLYLSKIAMDITAKRMQPDENGVRIAELDEMIYRKTLWTHRPITDFWRIGKGYAEKLAANGMYTMGDVARCALGDKRNRWNAELLYRLFGVNAELLIDHAFGKEECTIRDIRSYKPESSSLSNGQVLSCPYTFEKGRVIVQEMTDQLALALVEKEKVTDQIVLTVGYDPSGLLTDEMMAKSTANTEVDRYGRKVPRTAHGSVNLPFFTSSGEMMLCAVLEAYDRIVDPRFPVRRMYVVANHLQAATEEMLPSVQQTDLFTDCEIYEKERAKKEEALQKERKRQQAVLSIRRRFGDQAILKGINFEEGATGRERMKQIGGHRA